jgi:hypothetical protein
MNKIVGHVSVLGPASYDDESVLCQEDADCKKDQILWQSLQLDDSSMEAAIEDAQKKTIDIYAEYFPATYWTIDLVERQMPFFSPDGCHVPSDPFPPIDGNDASDCFGKLRTDLIDYIQAHYFWHGGVQNNSLDAIAGDVANHPVWRQTALAAQESPLNHVKLFVGFEVSAPANFYQAADRLFKDFETDDQTAVNLAKHMLPCYRHVDFIEFYDLDIANDFTLAQLNPYGSRAVPTPPQTEPISLQVNTPFSAINDDPGGFMHAPLDDAHFSLRRITQDPPPDCYACSCAEMSH